MSKPIDKKIYKTGFVSELDEFFHDFDAKRNDFPPSRLKEIAKHQAIFKKRDNEMEEEKQVGWQAF